MGDVYESQGLRLPTRLPPITNETRGFLGIPSQQADPAATMQRDVGYAMALNRLQRADKELLGQEQAAQVEFETLSSLNPQNRVPVQEGDPLTGLVSMDGLVEKINTSMPDASWQQKLDLLNRAYNYLSAQDKARFDAMAKQIELQQGQQKLGLEERKFGLQERQYSEGAPTREAELAGKRAGTLKTIAETERLQSAYSGPPDTAMQRVFPDAVWVQDGIPYNRAGQPLLTKPSTQTISTNILPGETEYAKTYGKQAAEQAIAFEKSVVKARSDAKTLGELEKALTEAGQTGTLKPFQVRAGQLASSLGLSPSWLKEVQNAEHAQSIIARRLVENIGGEGGFPANNFSDADRTFMRTMLPDLTTTPEGNKLIIESMRRANQAILAQGEAWRAYKKEHGSSARYNEFLDAYLDQQGDVMTDLATRAVEIAAETPDRQLYKTPEDLLRSDPDRYRTFYDQKYGKGSAARVLGE